MKTLFGLFHLYTWDEALAAGLYIDVSEDARRFGVRGPVAVTEAVSRCVAGGEGPASRDGIEALLAGLKATQANPAEGAATRFLVRVNDAGGRSTIRAVNIDDSPVGMLLWLPEEVDSPAGS